MDVDAPSVLKRCSSAPLINEAVAASAVSTPSPGGAGVSAQPRSPISFNMFSNSNQHRTRRFSASFSPLVQSPTAFMPRLTPRVNQLRKEECADVTNTREVAHEREIHSAIQMGQSWEDLTVTPGSSGSPAPMSPTRNRFSPAVSPSPTRRSYTTRRSLSPTIAIRPSCLSPVSRPSLLGPIKRRIEDGDCPSSKRVCPLERLASTTPGTPDSDSPIDCTFRPVSPSARTHQPFPREENHNQPNPS